MRRSILVLLGALTALAAPGVKAQTTGSAAKLPAPAKSIHLPLFFEANQGQTDSSVQFMARSKGYTLLLSPTETVLAESKTQVSVRSNDFSPFQSPRIETQVSRGSKIRMQLVGANSAPTMTGLDELPGKANYLIGNDPAKWHTDVALYSRVRTNHVYPGVDLLFHGDAKELEYDFVVAPGADASKIAFRIRGAERMEIDEHGDLVLHSADSKFLMHKPVIYQTVGSERRPVEGRFVRKGKHEVAFRVGSYDHAQTLVIDPAVAFATFLGGASTDMSGGFAIDDSTPGSPKLYLGGFTTDSTTFPEPHTIIGSGTTTTAPVVEEVGFVAKIDPTMTGAGSLNYLTFIGGSTPTLSKEPGCANAFVWLALDKSQGAANIVPVLGGITSCSNFPSATFINPVTDPTGNSDGIATVAVRMMPSGKAIDKAVILGGQNNVEGGFIAVGGGGNVILSGETQALNLPTKNAYVNTFNNGDSSSFDDCYVTILNRADLSISYMTYLNAGGGSTSGKGVGCGAFEDSSGNILAGGNTISPTIFNLGPGGASLANGFQTTFKGTQDTFAIKLDPSKVGVNQLGYATFFGGGGVTRAGNGSFDLGNGVVAIVGGTTSNTASGDIPLKNAFQTKNMATGDGMVGYVVLINTLQTGAASLQCGTYFGGTGGDDIVGAVTYDAGDPTNYRIIIGGRTNSATDFPTMNPIQPYVGAVVGGVQSPDAFLSVLKVPTPGQAPFNAIVVFSTYIGGSNPPAEITITPSPQLLEDDGINAVAVDASHTIYAAGVTNAPGGFFANTNPTTTVNGFQTTCASCNVQSPGAPENDVVVFSLGTGANATLVSIAVAPTSASITTGQTQQFRAIGNYDDGTEKDITSLVTWTTVPTGFATMSTTSPGLATGVAAGTTAVTPMLGTTPIVNTGLLTVTGGATATHFSVAAPANATAGTQFNITVAALDASNQTVTAYAGTVHFTSSDGAAVLPSNSGLTNGVMTLPVVLHTTGAQTITATDTVTASITGTSGTITVAAATQVTVRVATAGNGFGSVTDDMQQINCEQVGAGGVTAGSCTAQYASGTQVTFTATTPGTVASFTGTPTACTGAAGTCTVTVTATETVTATFNPGPGTFPLTVQAGAMHTGGGMISSSPAGINCTLAGTTTSGTCTTNFAKGQLVTLTQTTGAGSTFFGWSGTTPSCLSSSSVSCVVGMSAATTADAEFTSGGGTVNATVTGPGNVKDTANPGTINCTNTAGGTQTGTCTSGYALGTTVTLTETTTGTATFSGWTGASCANPNAATCSFIVTTASPAFVVAATFAAAAPATHFSVTAPANATAGTAFNFTVTALTASNTTATGYAGTVHFTSSDGAATLPANMTLTNGTGTFSATLQTAGAQTITATDTVTASITGSSGTVTVAGATGAALAITKSGPSTATMNTQVHYTIVITNNGPAAATGVGMSDPIPGSNNVPGFDAAVPGCFISHQIETTIYGIGCSFSSDLASGASITIPYHVTYSSNGTFTNTATVSGTNNTNTTNNSASVTTNVGAVSTATHFSVTAPANATAGTAFNFTVTALDANNQTVAGYTGTVHFTSTDGQAVLPANMTLTNGTGMFSATLKTAGGQTITATDTVTATITGTSGTITVAASAVATHFMVSASITQTAGVAFNVAVSALDASNAIVTGYTGTVHFTSSDGAAVLPANSTLTNGTGNFSVTLNTLGSQTITATDTVTATITGTSSAITVSSAAATHFSVTAPASATSGTAFNFTVTALDALNHTATSYAGTVHFTSTDGAATLPANSTLTNGVGMFSATLNTVGNQTITATDTVTASITGTSGTINVTAVAAPQLVVQTAGSGTGTVAGNGINCTSGSANGCTVSVSAGTQVTLTAMPGANSTFTSWSAICESATTTCSFTMPATTTMVTATFTVNAPTLKSIAVTPANPTEPINSSLQFHATGTFSDNSTKDITNDVGWSSSNGDAATISESGLATTGSTADLSTTISAQDPKTEIIGSTTLTVSNSPISVVVTPPIGGTFPPVPPGGKLAVGIVLTATEGFSGTVTFGCSVTTASGAPAPSINCVPDPASVNLTPNGPTQVAFVVNTFCTGSTNAAVPNPGGFGGGLGLFLLGMTLGGTMWMYRRKPRLAISFAVLLLFALGGVACSSLPKGANGATPPGDYQLTVTATTNGTTSTTQPIPFTVE